jgi:hypothetical protein
VRIATSAMDGASPPSSFLRRACPRGSVGQESSPAGAPRGPQSKRRPPMSCIFTRADAWVTRPQGALSFGNAKPPTPRIKAADFDRNLWCVVVLERRWRRCYNELGGRASTNHARDSRSRPRPTKHRREDVGQRLGSPLDLSGETGYNRISWALSSCLPLLAKRGKHTSAKYPYCEAEYTRRRAGHPAPVVFRC